MAESIQGQSWGHLERWGCHQSVQGVLEALEVMLSRCAGVEQAFGMPKQLGSELGEVKSLLSGARVGLRQTTDTIGTIYLQQQAPR